MSMIIPAHHAVHGRVIREEEHPIWTEAFQFDTRSRQLAEDHYAWASVTGTLLTILSIGVLLAVVSVSICVL